MLIMVLELIDISSKRNKFKVISISEIFSSNHSIIGGDLNYTTSSLEIWGPSARSKSLAEYFKFFNEHHSY